MAGSATSETSLLQVILQQLAQTNQGQGAPVAGEEGMGLMTPESSSEAPEAEEPLFLHSRPEPGSRELLLLNRQAGLAHINWFKCVHDLLICACIFWESWNTASSLSSFWETRALLEIACCAVWLLLPMDQAYSVYSSLISLGKFRFVWSGFSPSLVSSSLQMV